jgi:tetratricopeptide (TPR) repeat protein
MLQDPAALSLIEGALATARSLKAVPPSTEVRLLGTLAGVHATDRNWPAAIQAYEAAIAAGDGIHDLRRLSLTYSGLSLAYQELGQINQASHYSQRALAIHETLNDRASLARSENNLGLLLVRVGEPASARPHLERALRLFEETGVPGKSDVLSSLSELEFSLSNFESAAELAQQALTLAVDESAPGRIADAHLWLARIAAVEGRDQAADSEFAAAIEVLEAAGAAQRVALARGIYADVLEERGDLRGANDQLKQALASTRPASRTGESRVATA